jgi:hypothetical protein
MKSSSSMVPTAPEYQWGLLVAPYISSMSHNSGGLTNLEEKNVLKSPQMMMKVVWVV